MPNPVVHWQTLTKSPDKMEKFYTATMKAR
jgi:hypothetical protein